METANLMYGVCLMQKQKGKNDLLQIFKCLHLCTETKTKPVLTQQATAAGDTSQAAAEV